MSGTPFFIIPWDKDFLKCLADFIIKVTDGQPGSAIVVFTHDRPKRYFVKYLQQHLDLQKPCLLPQMLTVQELWERLYATAGIPLLHELGLLDQISILFSCVQKCIFTTPSMFNVLSGIDIIEFFPWGVHLAGLIEECLTHGLEPDNLLYTEGEVDPFAVVLLGSLGKIFALYKEHLMINRQTTPGLKAFTIIEQIRQNTFIYPELFQKKIFLAGFNTLSGTEEVLFHYLWDNGAYVCLYADPAITKNHTQTHWACDFQKKWIQSWNASTELVCPANYIHKNWHFFAGYDLHSQLKVLHEDLQGVSHKNTGLEYDVSTAVVLTHSQLLLPVLHHLPDKECNISLGYPLNSSLLFRLIDLIVKVRDSCQEDGSIYYKALVDLIRHPYLRLLEEDNVQLRESLQILEHCLFKSQRYVYLTDLIINFGEYIDGVLNIKVTLLEHVIQVVVSSWLEVKSLSMLAEKLGLVCELLLEYGNNIWKSFPLDAECLFRLIHKVIPEIKNNLMSDTILPWELLKSMLYAVIGVERVPFKADPLTGLQVLGMLETRLLHFSKIFIVDATDDYLPGTSIKNPLLPDSLRKVIGLPDTIHRDLLTAYTFYSLLAGVQDVYVYWQEGVEVSGLFDGKKQRSRFVEELLWKEEQRLGERIKLGGDYLRSITLDIQTPIKKRKPVIKTPLIQEQLIKLLSRPVSATLLDSYMSCPLRFYFERLCKVHPIHYLCEGDNHVAVGQLLHKVLKLYYKDYIGKVCYKNELSGGSLKRLFMEELENSGLMDMLPPESAMMLKIAGPEKLLQFLSKQPDKTEIVHIETFLQTTLTIQGKTRILEGVLDRVDRRDNKIVILDYKTGSVKPFEKNFWKDEKFWSALILDEPIHVFENKDMLEEVFKKISSIQLPYYIYLYTCAKGEDVYDAAIVTLRENGDENWLLGSLATDVKDDKVFIQISSLLQFLLLHMEYCTSFKPHEGKQCSWCSWNELCHLHE